MRNKDTEPTPINKVYTLGEAIEYMKMRDRQPTRSSIRWVDVKSGEQVSIIYNT